MKPGEASEEEGELVEEGELPAGVRTGSQLRGRRVHACESRPMTFRSHTCMQEPARPLPPAPPPAPPPGRRADSRSSQRERSEREREKEELVQIINKLTRCIAVADAMRALDTFCVDLKSAIKKLDKLVRATRVRLAIILHACMHACMNARLMQARLLSHTQADLHARMHAA
jgi:hypothetical protein